MIVSRIAAWGTGILLIIGACSSSEQPEQPSSTPQEQAPEAQAAVSQPAETTSETATSTEESTPAVSEDMAETKAKPAESEEKLAAQEESAPEATPMKSAPLITLGPNMLKVNASIVDVEETGNSYICTLNIEQILGRGASTPPLVRGNEIKVRIKKVVNQSEKLAEKGSKVEVTLQHALPMASIQPPLPAWTVMKVH